MDVIKTTSENLRKTKLRTIEDVYKQDRLLVDFSTKMKKNVTEIKKFLKLNMYDHKKVIINTNKGKRIINDLFYYLLRNHKKHMNNALFKKEQKERVIADFIAGMTDRYAINLHSKIK